MCPFLPDSASLVARQARGGAETGMKRCVRARSARRDTETGKKGHSDGQEGTHSQASDESIQMAHELLHYLINTCC